MTGGVRRSVLLAITAIALASCDGSTRGGVDTLPGPVPADVSFADPGRSAPPAPDFSLTLVDGTEVTGAELWEDRPVVLFFFASWCGTCPDQEQDLSALAERYDDAVAFLGVAGEDEADAVADYLEENTVDHPVAIDDDLDVWRNYAVREPPHVVVIAKGGRVFRGWPGGTTRSVIEETLSELVVVD